MKERCLWVIESKIVDNEEWMIDYDTYANRRDAREVLARVVTGGLISRIRKYVPAE